MFPTLPGHLISGVNSVIDHPGGQYNCVASEYDGRTFVLTGRIK